MRLSRLRLERYGAFEAADIRFDPAPGRITLLIAPNGAGKSILRQAFHDLLFDIPMQSGMKFRYEFKGMALYAEAVDAEGVPFSFGWVRGAKPQRVTSDEARFAALRRGVTPRQIEQLFALDTAGLRKGGTDLEGGTSLAGALLAGTGELAPAKVVRARIDQRRQANWGQGKSKPPLNAAAATLAQAGRVRRGAEQRPEARERAEQAHAAKVDAHTAARARDQGARADLRRLNRIKLTRPHLHALADAERWLANNPDAPMLPAGLDQALADARGEFAKAEVRLKSAADALARTAENNADIPQDEAAAQHAERLSALPGQLGEAENKAADLRDRSRDLTAMHEEIGAALRDIGTAIPIEQAATVIPTTSLLTETRAAIAAATGLATAAGLAQERVEQAAQAQADAARAPEPAASLPDGLLGLTAEIRADGDPRKHADEAAAAARVAGNSVVSALATIPHWSGSAAAMRSLSVLGEPGFERLDAAHQAAIRRVDDAAKAADAIAGQRATAWQKLQALRAEPLPDTAAVAAARALRDNGLGLVLRHAFATAPGTGEDHAYAGDAPVAEVFVRHIRAADDVADRRYADVQRVEAAEALALMHAELEVPDGAAVDALAEATGHVDRARQAWTDACAPLGAGPSATLTEIRATLAARTRLIDAMQAAETAEGAQHALHTRHVDWSTRLAAALELPPAPLSGLLHQADARYAAAQAGKTATATRVAQRAAAQAEADKAGKALTKALSNQAKWEENWERLLARLGRPPKESAVATAAILDALTKLDRQTREAASLAKRLGDMKEDLDRFAQTVAELARALGEAPGPTHPATARHLINRAEQARANASARQQTERSLAEATAAEQQARTLLDEARASLAATIAACGAATAEGATQRLTAARDRAAAAARRDQAMAALLLHGGGVLVAGLQADAEAIDPADEPARVKFAEDATTDATAAAEALAIEAKEMMQVLDRDAGATTAVDARADYEAAAAHFADRLDEQLVLIVASTMLGRAVHNVEEGLGDTSLTRVSQAFATVTAGAYTLETHDESGTDELRAVERGYPKERKSLGELSEGTRDQLYLALRMVALQDHCRGAMPLPFIADDILQTFDDRRARATLMALGGLSQSLQVIVLTHHDHLGQIAAELGEACVQVVRL